MDIVENDVFHRASALPHHPQDLHSAMQESKEFFGVLLAVAGVGLLAAPLILLDSSTHAGRADIVPVMQALGCVVGGVVALMVAWFLMRRL